MMKLNVPAVFLILLTAAALSGCFPVVATGLGAGVMMADDRRTSGIYIEDERIEIRAQADIAKLKNDKVHVNVTSFNRVVLLTGEVPDAATRGTIEKLVADVDNVNRVQNELAIGRPSTLGERSNDIYLTTKVKGRYLGNKSFSANHVKVVVEQGTVYLMGLVKHEEASAAAELSASTTGVKRVVKVFEYID